MVEVASSNLAGPTNFSNFYAAFRATPEKTALITTVRPFLDHKNILNKNQSLTDLLDRAF